MTDDQVPELTPEHFDKLIAARGEDFEYVPPGELDEEGNPPDECYYFDPFTKAPSCGVGWILDDLGFGPDDVAEFKGADEVIDRLVLARRLKLSNPLVLELAREFQTNQDAGTPYGDALAGAKHELSVVTGLSDPFQAE